MISKIACAGAVAFAVASTASVAETVTSYDGAWRLSLVTERGACDGYNLPVQITKGSVSIPGLDTASGRVSSDGAVHVSVAASGKSASGSGQLSQSAGRGRWIGRSGGENCSGSWTAHRF
jgi:hypothetical protein